MKVQILSLSILLLIIDICSCTCKDKINPPIGNVDYNKANGTVIRNALKKGLIVMSDSMRKKFGKNFENGNFKDYNDLTVCINKNCRVYKDRNVSLTSWFVCPWDNSENKKCSGKSKEQKCGSNGQMSFMWANCFIIPIVLYVVFRKNLRLYFIGLRTKCGSKCTQVADQPDIPVGNETRRTSSTTVSQDIAPPPPYQVSIEPDAFPPPYSSVVDGSNNADSRQKHEATY